MLMMADQSGTAQLSLETWLLLSRWEKAEGKWFSFHFCSRRWKKIIELSCRLQSDFCQSWSHHMSAGKASCESETYIHTVLIYMYYIYTYMYMHVRLFSTRPNPTYLRAAPIAGKSLNVCRWMDECPKNFRLSAAAAEGENDDCNDDVVQDVRQ